MKALTMTLTAQQTHGSQVTRRPSTRTHEHDLPQNTAGTTPQAQQHQPPHKTPPARPQLTRRLNLGY